MVNPGVVANDRSEALVGPLEDASRRQQIEQLFRAHEDFLRRLAVQLCRSAFDPEDLLQDVLERTVRHYHSLVSNHRAWMARVMRNLFIDRVRRHAAALPLAMLEDDVPAPV